MRHKIEKNTVQCTNDFTTVGLIYYQQHRELKIDGAGNCNFTTDM